MTQAHAIAHTVERLKPPALPQPCLSTGGAQRESATRQYARTADSPEVM